MARATWNGQLLARSDTFEVVEGNAYFPPTALVREHLAARNITGFVAFWKGVTVER